MRLSYFTFWTEKDWWNDLEKDEQDKYEATLTQINKTFSEVYRNRIKNLTTITHSNARQYSIPVIIMPTNEDVFYSVFRTGNSHTIILNSKKLLDENFPLFLSMAFIEAKIDTIRQSIPKTNEEIIVRNIIKSALPAINQNEYEAKRSYDHFNKNLFKTNDWTTLFSYFIAENTSEQFFTELARSEKIGIEAINDALEKAGSIETFSSLFEKWSLAVSANNRLLTNKDNFILYKNSYLNSEIFSGAINYTVNDRVNTIKVKPYSTEFIKYTPKQLGINEETKNILNIKIQLQRYPSSIYYITSDINSNRTIHKHTINSGRDDSIKIRFFGTYIMSVMLILDNPNKTEKTIKIHEYQSLTLENGDAIEYQDEIFVIKNEFIRKIPSTEIFNAYGHLLLKDVKNIDAQSIKKYKKSNLIKTSFSNKVFEIDKNNVLHWLDMSPSQFEKSGRTWNQIFIVNEYEINWYREGKKYTK